MDNSSNPSSFTHSEKSIENPSSTYSNPLNLLAEMATPNVDESSSSTPTKSNPITLPGSASESLIREVVRQIFTSSISSPPAIFVGIKLDISKYVDTSSSTQPL